MMLNEVYETIEAVLNALDVGGEQSKVYKFPCRTVLSALGREVPDWL